jgi:hypothetical protein
VAGCVELAKRRLGRDGLVERGRSVLSRYDTICVMISFIQTYYRYVTSRVTGILQLATACCSVLQPRRKSIYREQVLPTVDRMKQVVSAQIQVFSSLNINRTIYYTSNRRQAVRITCTWCRLRIFHCLGRRAKYPQQEMEKRAANRRSPKGEDIFTYLPSPPRSTAYEAPKSLRNGRQELYRFHRMVPTYSTDNKTPIHDGRPTQRA